MKYHNFDLYRTKYPAEIIAYLLIFIYSAWIFYGFLRSIKINIKQFWTKLQWWMPIIDTKYNDIILCNFIPLNKKYYDFCRILKFNILNLLLIHEKVDF